MNKINSWDDKKLNLKDNLLRGIYAYGFENPSSIQKVALHPLIYGKSGSKRDMIAQAQSGTGKTGTFVVGSLQVLNEKSKDLQVLMLAPTHELARQIKTVLDTIGLYLKINSLLLVGGTSVDNDKKLLLNNDYQVVVGTPGRVQDMIRRKCLKSLLLMDN